MRKKVVETCEMCSIDIPSPVTIKVEGALLRVCFKCTSFGNVVREPTKTVANYSEKQIVRKSSVIPARRTRKNTSSTSPQSAELELIGNYGKTIKNGRMRKKLNQEQLSSLTGISVPFIKSIEAEKMRPTDAAARKLERELGISLLEAPDAELEYTPKSEKKGTTLGDIVVIKRYDYD